MGPNRGTGNRPLEGESEKKSLKPAAFAMFRKGMLAFLFLKTEVLLRMR